jgi:hypothetical protein
VTSKLDPAGSNPAAPLYESPATAGFSAS